MAISPDNKLKLLRLAGGTAAKLITAIHARSKIVVHPHDAIIRVHPHAPFVFAMWHGQFMMLPALRTSDIKVAAIVAKHGDAEIIGVALERFNVRLIRGAGAGGRKKDRGGSQALRLAIRALGEGTTLAITADVPPGPARRAGEGIVTLARISGRPIVPFAAATSRYLALRTWSRMTINLPYGKLAYVIGDPIFVPADASYHELEVYRLKIEAALNSATEKAYELAGADPRRATPARADTTVPNPGLRLKGYRAATSILRPVAPVILARREAQGKEDPKRRAERYGIASAPRPPGKVVWVHAASVGETNAALPLITELLAKRPELHFVLTTGTVTSAALAEQRLPPEARHQYVPLDAVSYVRRFLDHWRPDLALFTESEIWPNLLLETANRKIPAVLFNARMSQRSFKRWSRRKNAAGALFGRFAKVLAQNDTLARRFRDLGSRDVIAAGNIKIDAPPPPVDPVKFAELRQSLGDRPVFLAASTHDGEEAMIADAHRIMARECDGLCTIIVPRHPERGPAIKAKLFAQGITALLRSGGTMPSAGTSIYIADTIGELGTFYALAPVSFIGGSLIPHGGQNPIEAVAHGSAVLTGPHWHNFSDVYGELIRLKGAIEVYSSAELAARAAMLLKNPSMIEKFQAGAKSAMLSLGGALDTTVAVLLPMIDAAKGDQGAA